MFYEGHLFIGFRSTQILAVLLFLGTTTTPLYHGVGLSNFDMMQVIPCGLTHSAPSDEVVVQNANDFAWCDGDFKISYDVPRPENNLGLLSCDFN